jgi:hypothetical protein
MNDENRDIGLVIADAFKIIRNNPDTVRQIERQTDSSLKRAELIARLAIEQLYDANVIRLNVKELGDKMTAQADEMATLATEVKPTNRAEFLAMLIMDSDEEMLKAALCYLGESDKVKLWDLLNLMK